MENFELGPWKAFAETLPEVRCSPGHLIYLQNTEATCFYYLKKGRVKSFIQSDGGAERVLNVYQAGSLFGEAAVARDPELAMSMLQYLARTVRLLSEQLDDMAFRPVPWRLARFLLSGADQLSTVHSTQDEMAASISASRVTVSRTLNDFARRGWVELGYREVRLLRPEELRALCRT